MRGVLRYAAPCATHPPTSVRPRCTRVRGDPAGAHSPSRGRTVHSAVGLVEGAGSDDHRPVARAARESPSPAMTHRTRDRRACSPATSRSCSMTRRAERRCPDRCEPKDKPARGARHRSQDRPSGRRPTGCDPLDQAPRMAGTLRLAPGRFEARSAKPESTSSSHAGAVQSARGWRVVHATLGRRTPAMSSARIDVHRAGRIASLCASRSSKRSPLTPRTGAAVTAPRGARSARPAGGAAPA